MKRRVLTRTVILLSVVSLFNDISSEMLYPVIPLFLQQVGFSALGIGVLEGLAQVIGGLTVGFFGHWSDRIHKRMPFVITGYLVSALAKPLMAISNWPLLVAAMRITDRTGKGIRTSPRDSMLSSESFAETAGRVFAFHRAVDTLGAVAGPVIALLFLMKYPGNFTGLIMLTLIPGLLAVLFTLRIREKPFLAEKQIPQSRPGFLSFVGYWKISSTQYKWIAGGLIGFALFNSADAFLILKGKDEGLDPVQIITGYICYNSVFALSAFPAGMLADRWGIRKTISVGILFFILTYSGFIFLSGPRILYISFVLYGIYAALTDGIARAWISRICGNDARGTALGFYQGFASLGTFVSSTVTGFIWVSCSPDAALLFTLSGAVLFFIYLVLILPIKKIH
ncbi:MAG: MFS transporter [Bacteroidia bacterium]|nr:MFS transporter [Bacteroidia bacterium]